MKQDLWPPHIERCFPIPEKHAARPPTTQRWMFLLKLKIGESFLVDSRTVQTCAIQAGRKLGLKFTSRKVDGGARVWRIK